VQENVDLDWDVRTASARRRLSSSMACLLPEEADEGPRGGAEIVAFVLLWNDVFAIYLPRSSPCF